jgi:hypothetical protein
MKETGFSETQETKPVATQGKAKNMINFQSLYHIHINKLYSASHTGLHSIWKSIYLTYEVISYLLILIIMYEITTISVYYSQWIHQYVLNTSTIILIWCHINKWWKYHRISACLSSENCQMEANKWWLEQKHHHRLHLCDTALQWTEPLLLMVVNCWGPCNLSFD